MPASLRRTLGLEGDSLVLRLKEGRLEASLSGGGGERRLLSVPLDGERAHERADALAALAARAEAAGARVDLVLDTAETLRRTFRLPRLPEAEFRSALGFEIERHTPFRADEVYFAYAFDAGAAEDGSLAVDAILVPRRIVDPVLQELRAAGLAPDAVGLAAEKAANIRPLFVGGLERSRPAYARATRAMALLALLLLAAAVASPLVRVEMAAADLAAKALALKQQAEVTIALGNELDRLTRGARAVARAKAESTSPVALLNALSDVLPDGTWLSHVALVAGEVVIEGWTRSSAELVGLLEGSGQFHSVSYLSPVTREGERGLERFSFSARQGTR